MTYQFDYMQVVVVEAAGKATIEGGAAEDKTRDEMATGPERTNLRDDRVIVEILSSVHLFQVKNNVGEIFARRFRATRYKYLLKSKFSGKDLRKMFILIEMGHLR